VTRKELFPADRGLQARMIVALLTAAATAILAVAAVAWLAIAVVWWAAVIFVAFAVDGYLSGRRKPRTAPARKGAVGPGRQIRARETLGRLAALGGMCAPKLVFEDEEAPLSWTTAQPWREPAIHVTRGLVYACEPPELEAILAHELSHIANRDAWVMTVLAGPPTWILEGIRGYWAERHEDGWRPVATLRYAVGMVVYGSWVAALTLPWALTTRAVSRHRELAADRGAALLTGSPAQVAAALRTLSAQVTVPDLRLALLTPLPGREGKRRLWATHPPLERRVAQLEAMERSLHAVRT
jgi:heat shock protein HtpX